MRIHKFWHVLIQGGFTLASVGCGDSSDSTASNTASSNLQEGEDCSEYSSSCAEGMTCEYFNLVKCSMCLKDDVDYELSSGWAYRADTDEFLGACGTTVYAHQSIGSWCNANYQCSSSYCMGSELWTWTVHMCLEEGVSYTMTEEGAIVDATGELIPLPASPTSDSSGSSTSDSSGSSTSTTDADGYYLGPQVEEPSITGYHQYIMAVKGGEPVRLCEYWFSDLRGYECSQVRYSDVEVSGSKFTPGRTKVVSEIYCVDLTAWTATASWKISGSTFYLEGAAMKKGNPTATEIKLCGFTNL